MVHAQPRREDGDLTVIGWADMAGVQVEAVGDRRVQTSGRSYGLSTWAGFTVLIGWVVIGLAASAFSLRRRLRPDHLVAA